MLNVKICISPVYFSWLIVRNNSEIKFTGNTLYFQELSSEYISRIQDILQNNKFYKKENDEMVLITSLEMERILDFGNAQQKTLSILWVPIPNQSGFLLGLQSRLLDDWNFPWIFPFISLETISSILETEKHKKSVSEICKIHLLPELVDEIYSFLVENIASQIEIENGC